ncbi:YpmS family protein [Bacillus sp. B15-48]|uniref:YpmS family protein n=1 Tax=Bacillus sp. B15-48 TaxID=1548601 RepID=UPI00193FEBBF|nr:YpmS family protein [Bacillus sp. B15-48]MBM4762032.1 DUF2140 family protein [Bacillus sp. B15-48]
MKNKWRLAFFILLGVVMLLFISVMIMVSSSVHNEELNSLNNNQLNEGNGEVTFEVAANKADLNKIINHYLQEEGFTGPINYQVFLDEEVELYGSFPVFGQNVQMLLTFEPRALESGDLILIQKTISIGTLKLPVSYVLKFIHDNYKLPEWVHIQPSEEMVYVSLQELELKSDIKVRANSFDLKRDDISFTLLVPVQ